MGGIVCLYYERCPRHENKAHSLQFYRAIISYYDFSLTIHHIRTAVVQSLGVQQTHPNAYPSALPIKYSPIGRSLRSCFCKWIEVLSAHEASVKFGYCPTCSVVYKASRFHLSQEEMCTDNTDDLLIS